MSESCTRLPVLATEKAGSIVPRGEENFPADFGLVARALWPKHTAKRLAAIAKTSDRAAKDWLNGSVAAPAIVIAEIVIRITRRE
jgi:hypothetical protein